VRTLERIATVFIVTIVAAYTVGGVLVWRFPDRFIEFPEAENARTPAAFGIFYTSIWLRAGPRRELIHGWWLPNGRDAPVVLLLHGTGRTIRGMVHVAAALHGAGAAVLMIDYRGTGRSDRVTLTERTMYEDAEAAWQELRWLQSKPARHVVYGHSLGGAIALDLAARYPDMAGVIVESTPTSIRDLLRTTRLARLYPVDWLLHGRFDAKAKLARIGAPILFIHGKNDAIVPPAMGLELYGRASEPKRLLLVAGAAHSNAAIVGAAEYEAAIALLLPSESARALAAVDGRLMPMR